MTMIVRDRLRSKGLAVTENADEADAKYQITGTFSVSGRGRERNPVPWGSSLDEHADRGVAES